VATTCEPATGSADAQAASSDDFPIVLSCCFVYLEPLDTGCEGEHCHHMAPPSAENSDFQHKLGDEPLSYATEPVAPVGENELWKMMSFILWVHIKNESLAKLLPRKSCLSKTSISSEKTEFCKKVICTPCS